MYSSQQRAHITQPRRNPTISRYTEDSRSFIATQDLDIDLTKRTATDLTRHANPGADSSYFDEESSFDDYASEASGSSFSSTASLVDQLGGTYDEPEPLVPTAPSSSPSPPTPIIPTKAPKPVGVFSIADFMKNVQAPPAVQPTVAPPVPQHAEDSLHKRSSAYSQSSKEPMTSIDPQDEENTWESGNQANDYDGQDHDDSSSGFPALDSSSDNSVLSDPPMYDQNYDRSFEEEENDLKEIDHIEEDSPPEAGHQYQELAPSPAPSVPSTENAVFSQVNPFFTRRTYAEPVPQPQATALDQIDSRPSQSLYQNDQISSANSSVRSHRSGPKRSIPLPPPVPEVVAPVVSSVGASAPLPVLSPLVPSQPFNEADAEEIQFVVDEPPPPPAPLQEEEEKDRQLSVSTNQTYTSPLKSDQLPAQLQLEPEEDVDSDIDAIHTMQNNEHDIAATSTATAATVAAANLSATTNNRSRGITNFADEYSTMGTYSHYFHTPLPADPPSIATPPLSAVAASKPPPSDVATEKKSPIAYVPSILPATVTSPASSSSIERADLNRISTPPADNTATVTTTMYSSPIANANATANPNSPSLADIALTTTSSRFRGRYLSPDKVRASLLTATATPAMSSPVPDTGRVDRFRNKKGMGANGTVSLSDSMKGKAANESEADERKSVTDTDICNAAALSPATSGKPSNTYKPEDPHNTTDTAGSLYSNMETQSFTSSLRALNDAKLLLQYKTSLLLQSQLIDKILQQRSTLLDSQDPEQQLRLQMTIDITTEMLQKSVLESSILSSAVFSAQPSLNSTATYTQDSNISYSQSSLSVNPAVSANKRSVSSNGASSRMLVQSNESVPVPPPLKHYTYGPHAVTATPPRTSHSALRGSASATASTHSARSSTPTATATATARRTRSNTPNIRTVQPKSTTKEQSAPPPSPLPSALSEQVSKPGAARSDALRRTPSGTIISSPLSGSLKRANSVTKTSTSRNTARSELDRVNHTYSGSGSRSIRNASIPANLVITPVKTGDDGIDLIASTMNNSIQLFSSTPLSHDTFRRNASLVNSLLGNIDNYCNCCRTKLIDMDAQKNMKLKHSQCRNCLHSK